MLSTEKKDYFIYDTFYTNLMITTKHKSNGRQRKKNENIVENHLTKITETR